MGSRAGFIFNLNPVNLILLVWNDQYFFGTEMCAPVACCEFNDCY